MKTIDEHCNQPNGEFKKFIQHKEQVITQHEQARKDRMRGAPMTNLLSEELNELMTMLA
jgi:hypothetical protein